ncbi:phosphonate utilization associated putative membrane protein [Roseibium album]|nr:phosphonate utilization associated putative membrane protein [Roseibium album]
MTTGVALIVLTAALFHAVWNALVKGAEDRVIMLGLIALGHIPAGLLLVFMFPLPNPSVWPWLVASVVVHWGYFWLLNVAYRLGDLSLIYPVARGLAPVLVALIAQVWLGEVLPPLAWAGVILVSIGILVLARDAFTGALPAAGLIAALAVGVSVSAYSLIDGIGVRLSGSAAAYIGWLFSAKILIVLYVFPTRMDRFRAIPAKQLWIGFAGGLVSGAAYALVLYAKTLAPLGLVSALRETSVIFAALIGVIWFREGPRGRRILASVIVSAGIVVIGATA